ncbi:MAG: efflux RND transporter periplasmic adaptor subunit, partial [Ferruginibacter sp.]
MKYKNDVPGCSAAIKHLWRRTLVQQYRHGAIVLYFIVLLVSCKSKQPVTIDAGTYYTCSMDPQVIEFKPGKCPICHMELTLVKKSQGKKEDELMLSAQQIQLGNIQTDTIRTGAIGDQLVLTATLNFDQSKASSVSSRVMGRIERLYFKDIGEYIKKGAPLYDLYSEDLNNAKQEYLLALERKQTFAEETAIDFGQLLESAKSKLLLWGLNEAQVKQLALDKKAMAITTFYSTASGYITALPIREGDYVNEGGTIVNLTGLSTLWAEAQVYSSQLAAINLNGNATVQLPDREGKEISGKIDFVNPEISPDTRINLLRVAIPNSSNDLRPGMPAYVVFKSPRRTSLSLPIDAVIRDGKGASVWIRTSGNSFKNKMVQLGLESNDR